MNLSDYIAQIGDSAAARLFGIPERTAKSYRNGERLPRPGKALQIIDATGGKVDWAGIYAPRAAVNSELKRSA